MVQWAKCVTQQSQTCWEIESNTQNDEITASKLNVRTVTVSHQSDCNQCCLKLTRCSATADGLRGRAMTVKILSTVETSCTTNPQQIEVLESEGYS